MSEFFNMGGYASYIWPAYGLSALVLIGLTLQSLAAYRRARRDVASLETKTPYDNAAAPSRGAREI